MMARQQVMEEALRWVVVLQDEDATKAEQLNFARWLAEDPAHAAAWRRARRVWDHAAVAEPVFREAALAAAQIVPLAARRRRHAPWAAMAAALALLMAGGFLLGPGLFADQRTAAGERRTIVLADGSTVEMGSATALSAVMGGDARRITLYGGEAFFTVAPDPARPFEVVAEGGRIRALGTAFNVRAVAQQVTVAVTEHAVAVSGPAARQIRVGEGEQFRYGRDGKDAVSPADPWQVQAWRRDRLIFQEAPLREVVAELERYRGGTIVITDQRVADMPVTAVFDSKRTAEALQTIAGTLPVRVTHWGELLTLIRPAE